MPVHAARRYGYGNCVYLRHLDTKEPGVFDFRYRAPLAATCLLMGSAAFAQTQATVPRAEGVPRVPTAPGVTRPVEAAPNIPPTTTDTDGSKPETASDSPAEAPETANDDQKMTPESATDNPRKPDADKKAEELAKQGVRSNTPPPPKPPDK
jgi:hypothetical protein